MELDRKEQEEWMRQYGDQVEIYQQKMDSFLKNWDTYGRKAMDELLSDPEFKERFWQTEVFAYVRVLRPIWMEEETRKVPYSFVTGIDSVEKLLFHAKCFMFLLWRIEFQPGDDTVSSFVGFILRNRISSVAVEHFVYTFAMRKMDTVIYLQGIFREEQMHEYALAILQRAMKENPKDQMAICETAELCCQLGETMIANQLLSRISEPSEILERYCTKWKAAGYLLGGNDYGE
jgi:hypothetical protein